MPKRNDFKSRLDMLVKMAAIVVLAIAAIGSKGPAPVKAIDKPKNRDALWLILAALFVAGFGVVWMICGHPVYVGFSGALMVAVGGVAGAIGGYSKPEKAKWWKNLGSACLIDGGIFLAIAEWPSFWHVFIERANVIG